MAKDKQNQEEELNIREEVSRLVKLSGITRISGRRAGHYNSTNLNKIPEEKILKIYKDLTQIYRRFGYRGVA